MTDKKLTWMKIHSGINEPKHRDAMGVRIWLFMYLIDHADWETGRVDGFRDGVAADAMEMPQSTIRKWRTGLQDSGYITSEPGFQCQNIIIRKWRDPRQVNPQQININGECPFLDTHPSSEMDTHPAIKVDTLHIDHIDHTTTPPPPNIFVQWERIMGFSLTVHYRNTLLDWADTYSEEWVVEAMQKAAANNVRKPNYVNAILERWQAEGKHDRRNGKTAPRRLKPVDLSDAVLPPELT